MSPATPDGASVEASESGPSTGQETALEPGRAQPDPSPAELAESAERVELAEPTEPAGQAEPEPSVPAQAPQPASEAVPDADAPPPPPRKVRLRRTRRFFRRPTVRVISALVGVLVVWVAFSAGQETFANNGQGAAANLAEWAREHHLGPIVTFGEWLSYNPPKVGGKPSMSLAVPQDERVTPVAVTKAKHHRREFVPDIPATLKSLAGKPITGEGQWRVVEKVNGQPAILTTFLRDATYTSYVNGIASIDQRLVRFFLRPGYEDPGYGDWKAPFDVPVGGRLGLLATFNGGFKISDAGGGFYLNGVHYDALVNGAASVVYYKNGTIKIGQWGRDFTMNPSIAGVRQNLKLLVDHGKISPNLNSDIETGWGATLGGGYFVWRSGLGITSDGRIVYVYGPALDVQDLAELLRRAGAVEGMQMDINPAWMKFDYYQVDGHPGDPTPMPLLPTQQPSPYSYYDPSTRDFTAVYAR
jgi:Phosphodiester glycosidase